MKRIAAILVSLVLLLVCCSVAPAEEEAAARSEDEEAIVINGGDIPLKIRFDFREDLCEIYYDIDIFLDDIFIATVQQGEYYRETLMVTKGEHTATFFRTDREEVQHTYTFEVEKPSMISWAYKKVDTKTDFDDF